MRVQFCYSIVTEESSEYGDFAENGFYQPGGYQFPIPHELHGDAIRAFQEEYAPGIEYTAADWLDEGHEHEDYPEARAAAAALIYDGYAFDGATEWASVWDDDWTDETEDGTPGCRERTAHMSPHIVPIIRYLVEHGADAFLLGDCQVEHDRRIEAGLVD